MLHLYLSKRKHKKAPEVSGATLLFDRLVRLPVLVAADVWSLDTSDMRSDCVHIPLDLLSV